MEQPYSSVAHATGNRAHVSRSLGRCRHHRALAGAGSPCCIAGGVPSWLVPAEVMPGDRRRGAVWASGKKTLRGSALRKFKFGRTLMQPCFLQSRDGNPKSSFCSRELHDGHYIQDP